MKKYTLIDKIAIILLLFHCLIVPIFIFTEKIGNIFVDIYSILVFFSTIYYLSKKRYK